MGEPEFSNDIVLANELRWKGYEQVSPFDFYHDIFPDGELAEESADPKSSGHGYTGILVEIENDPKTRGRSLMHRYSVFDDLDAVSIPERSQNFCVMAPISYIGKSRRTANARFMYALCVEIDNLKTDKNKRTGEVTQIGLHDLIHQWSKKKPILPQPSSIVCSGNGLHLYYIFEKPIPLFDNVKKELERFKRELTRKLWNNFITEDWEEEKVQYESPFQAFRMPGSVTKDGKRRAVAFRIGPKVSIDYMNQFVKPENQITMIYKSDLTLSQAKEKYPEWYDRRIVNHGPKKHWVCNRAVYDWWLNRITTEATVGHRYYCLMMLSIYAIKCDIPKEELEADCLRLRESFDDLSTDRIKNPFTLDDVMSALQAFEDSDYATYPVNSIANRSGLHIEKNKRNYRKQKTHLKIARSTLEIMNEDSGSVLQGRPDKQQIVQDWQQQHPGGRKADCIRETGLAKHTVYKWWKE